MQKVVFFIFGAVLLSSVYAATPGLGNHTMAYIEVGVSSAPITTPSITTQSNGSVIVVGVGRGTTTNFALPHDNKNNTYKLQAIHSYAHPNEFSGTGVYSVIGARGGVGFNVTVPNGFQPNGQLDEITVFVVEIIGGLNVSQVAWSEDTSETTHHTSPSVTVSGPATLLAFWWGEGSFSVMQTATTNNGFTVINSLLIPGNVVQGAVAYRTVTVAGTYNVQWTATPAQGAQLWLIAVPIRSN